MVSYVPQVREKQMVRICLYVYVCVAPPMIVGAWSMAVVLWLLHEYYLFVFILCHISCCKINFWN